MSDRLPEIRARHDAGRVTGSDVGTLLAILDLAEVERLQLIEAGMGLQMHVMHHCDSMATITEPDCRCGLRGKMAVFLAAYQALPRYDQWSMTEAGKVTRAQAATHPEGSDDAG